LGCRSSSTEQGPKVDGDRTYEYWGAISRAQEQTIQNYAMRGPANLENVVGLLHALAESVEALSAEGVDPEAIEVGHGIAESMRRLASFLPRNLSAAAALPATVRDLLFGDMSVFKEQAADARAVRTFIEEAAAKAHKMRELLASRYDREFPALDAAPAGPDLPRTFRLCQALTAVPPEVELARLRHESAALRKAAERVWEELARATGEEADLKRTVAALSEKAERENDPARKKALAADLAARRKLQAAKTDGVAKLQERVRALREQQKAIDANLAELAAALAAVRQKGNDLTTDTNELRACREKLEEIQRRLDAEKKKLELQEPRP
jgi:hypothetical protein